MNISIANLYKVWLDTIYYENEAKVNEKKN